MTEADLKNAVVDFARWCGWLVHHDLPALDQRGNWRTHVQGDAGFPDLALVHPRAGRFVVAELKGEKGRTTSEQDAWLAAFANAGVETYVWRPSDWEAVEKCLRVTRVTST